MECYWNYYILIGIVKKNYIMNKKRVYSQKELIKILNVSRKEIRFIMYQKGIHILTQHDPYTKKIKSGYLIEDINEIGNEIAIKKTDKYKSFIVAENKKTRLFFLIEINNESIFKAFSRNYDFIFFVESNYLDLEKAIIHSVDEWNFLSTNELKDVFVKLNINFIELK